MCAGKLEHCGHIVGGRLGRPCRRAVPGGRLFGAEGLARIISAQVEFESKSSKQCITLQFQALSSSRCQRGSDRVKLQRPTTSHAQSRSMRRHRPSYRTAFSGFRSPWSKVRRGVLGVC